MAAILGDISVIHSVSESSSYLLNVMFEKMSRLNGLAEGNICFEDEQSRLTETSKI